MPGRTRADTVDARGVRFGATIEIAGALFTMPATDQRRDLHAETRLALKSGAAVDSRATFQPVTHARGRAIAAESSVVDQSAWAVANAFKAGIPVATVIGNFTDRLRREARRRAITAKSTWIEHSTRTVTDLFN